MNAVADMLVVGLVFATLAQAWSWLGAYAGVVSLGHAVFFGIGAYAVAVSNLRGGSPWYGALGGGLAAVLVAALCGSLFLRGRGEFFSAITLGAGAFAAPFVASHTWVGAGNVLAFAPRLGFLNLQFRSTWTYVLIAGIVFAVTQALTWGLRSSRVGLYLRALRSNAVAARSSGIAGGPPRLLVLVASAFVTSVAGSFCAEYRLGVDPQSTFALTLSFDIALIGSLAGPSSLWGAPLAALAYVALTKVVPLHPPGAIGDVVLVVQGLIVVLIVRLCPAGVWQTFARPRRSAVLRTTA